jgi:hypothetical protein
MIDYIAQRGMFVEVRAPQGNTQAVTEIVDISTLFFNKEFLRTVAEQTAVLSHGKIKKETD